jgi:hypothetical protein
MMPGKQEILETLQSIANKYSTVAILWHIIFYMLIICLFSKWVPSNRLFGVLLSLPLLSVAFFAWLSGNPFNGSLFSIMAVLILLFGLKLLSYPISYS